MNLKKKISKHIYWNFSTYNSITSNDRGVFFYFLGIIILLFLNYFLFFLVKEQMYIKLNLINYLSKIKIFITDLEQFTSNLNNSILSHLYNFLNMSKRHTINFNIMKFKTDKVNELNFYNSDGAVFEFFNDNFQGCLTL